MNRVTLNKQIETLVRDMAIKYHDFGIIADRDIYTLASLFDQWGTCHDNFGRGVMKGMMIMKQIIEYKFDTMIRV